MTLRLRGSAALCALAVGCADHAAQPARQPAPAAYHWLPAAEENEIDCELEAPSPCDGKSADACEATLPALARECERDPVCGCVRYGRGLTLARPEHHVAGIQVLDAACVRGVMAACDDAALISELCDVGRFAPPACRFLAPLGRTPDRAPWLAAALPRALVGCFSLRSSGAGPASPSTAWDTVCLNPDRLSYEIDGAWNQHRVTWTRRPDGHAFGSNDHALRLDADGRTAWVYGATHAATRLAPAEQGRAFAAVRSIGDVDIVCARADRCARVTKPGERLPDTVVDCAKHQADAIAYHRATLPEEPLPDVCVSSSAAPRPTQ